MDRSTTLTLRSDPASLADPQRWDHEWFDDGVATIRHRRSGDTHVLRFGDSTEFELKPTVCLWRTSATDEADVARLVVDQLLPRYFDGRGLLVVHSSAVIVNDATVMFIGPSGVGKSSVAAMFALNGHAVVGDDSQIFLEAPQPLVVTSPFAGIRLAPGPLAAQVEALSVTTSMTAGKQRMVVAQPSQPFPVQLLAMLTDGPTEAAEPLSTSAATMMLVEQGFRLDIHDRDRSRTQLDQAIAVARATDAVRLTVPRGDRGLRWVYDQIIERL